MTDMRERVGRGEAELGRAARTPRDLRTRACRRQLSENLVRESATTRERDPKRGELVKLDARMLAPVARMCEQPIDASVPVTAVKVDLARHTLDRMAAACLVADPRSKVDRLRHDIVGIRHSSALKEVRRQPIACIQRQPGKNAVPGFAVDMIGSLQRIPDTTHPP